jgi:predicted RNA binding protein YcfA (HicA-like mRNA interferase family)
MTGLPKLSGEELILILEQHGYHRVRTRGSHARMYPPDSSSLKKVTVPLHKELKRGTLSNIIKDAGLNIEDLK